MPADDKNKVTIVKLNKLKEKKEKAVLVTAYDYPQALLADKAGVDCILLGDSIGMTTYGYKTTIPVTMEEMLPQARAIARASSRAFLIGDMPFLSYQESNELAIRNAGEFIRAGMDCIKVEGPAIERVRAIAKAGMIVMSHLGLTPQTRAKLGGYKVQGKTKEDYEKILGQAKSLEDAGCSFLLLEAMPREPAAMIAEQLTIPVYGIGAGDGVDGQLVIMHDLIGMFFEFKSKFVKRYCEAGQLIQNSLSEYASEVRNGQFPSEEHFYKIDNSELEKLLGDDKWKYTELIHPGC